MRFLKGLAIFVAIVGGLVLTVGGLVQRAPHLAAIGICLPFAVTALTSPVLRRLAIRHATRRPKEALLILLGSLLGTAIVTSSAVVGDTFASSIRETVHTQLGPVDEVIISRDPAVAADVTARVRAIPGNDIDGVLRLQQVRGAAGVSGNDPRVQRGVNMIDVPLEQAATFGGDPDVTGISGGTPTSGHVVISDDLARSLDVEPGATIELYVLGEKRSVIVDRMLPRLGLAGLNVHEDNGSSYNVFVAPGSLAADPQSKAVEHLTLISNRGGVIDGRELTQALDEPLHRAIVEARGGVAPELPKETRQQARQDAEFEGGPPPLALIEVKDMRIKDADAAGQVFSRLFTGIGSFTIIAGVLLLINIFTMLAQERQSELGMLRAIGMRRRSLIGVFSLEGFLYGIGAAALGTAVGTGMGALVVTAASSIFSGVEDEFELIFDAQPVSLAWGFLAGLGISVLTVVLASLFIARMNVIRAIRELPDNSLHRRRLVGLIFGVLLLLIGALVTSSGITNKGEFAVLLGPAVAAIGAVLTLRRWAPTKWVMTVSSIAVLAWSVAAFTVVEKAFVNANPGVYVVQGVLLTAFAVMLISANQEHIGGLLRRVSSSSWSMALRLGLAYPLARRGRTGLLLAMYSLIVFVLTFIITISHVLTTGVEKQVAIYTGGIDIEVVPAEDNRPFDGERKPLPIEALRQHPDVSKVAPLIELNDIEVIVNEHDRTLVDALAVDENYIGNGSGTLKSRDPKFANDDEVYRAVAASENLVVVGEGVARARGQEVGLQVGQAIRLGFAESDQRPVNVTVAAVSNRIGEVVVGNKAATALSGGQQPTPERANVQVRDGVDAQRLANQISGLYVSDDIEAFAVQESIEEGFTIVRQFMLLIQGYLAVGLLVGIAGLGVTMVRAVHERRRQIGMLRAMGFQSKAIRQAFLAEAAFIAGEGILIGAGLALVVLARIFASLPSELPLELDVPWLYLSGLVGVTFIASMLAVAAPARQASRVPPAVALRTVD